jgi:DUF971 family protein
LLHRLIQRSQVLQVLFNTGERFCYPAELLRVESPAAAPATDPLGRPLVVHGKRGIGIYGIEPVGRYAIRLSFDDLHANGIYSWDFLHNLGTHKVRRIRDYLEVLKYRGLSREMRKPKTKR